MVETKIWVSEIRNLVGIRSDRKKYSMGIGFQSGKQRILAILAFEAARTMCRIVSLYKILTHDEIKKLRNLKMRSDGVAYLNSKDQLFLLRLACAELIEELDRAASSVSRLGAKCFDPRLQNFEKNYAVMKRDTFLDYGSLGFSEKEMVKKVRKMEKYISETSNLYSEMEILSEMEASEKRLEEWMSYSGPMPAQTPKQNINTETFLQKLKWQKQQVDRLCEMSLYGQTFDKIVGLMSDAICTVYLRICAVFSPYVPELPRMGAKLMKGHNRSYFSSGPIHKPAMAIPVILTRNSGPILRTPNMFWTEPSDSKGPIGSDEKKLTEPPEHTVGGAALALQYANLVILAEEMLNSPETADEESREELYRMMPSRLRAILKSKLKRFSSETGWGSSDGLVAEGWKQAVTEILRWLSPMAHDTIQWQSSRNLERQGFEPVPVVLKLQTFYFSDREKTEAAIAEVLVGLSCICRYDEKYRASGSEDGSS